MPVSHGPGAMGRGFPAHGEMRFAFVRVRSTNKGGVPSRALASLNILQRQDELDQAKRAAYARARHFSNRRQSPSPWRPAPRRTGINVIVRISAAGLTSSRSTNSFEE